MSAPTGPTSSGGYSATPQASKLGLREGQRIELHQAPKGWVLHQPPDALVPVRPPESADVILAFFTEAADLAGQIAELGRRIRPAGALWVLWPRRAAGHVSEVTENGIRDAALPLGLVDVKVAAVDENWSGLRLVWRRDAR